jgi:hypothetical protein
MNPETFEWWATGATRSRGIKLTQTVRDVLSQLVSVNKPTTALDLHGLLSHRRYDRSTIYRILTKFWKGGLVQLAFVHQNSRYHALVQLGQVIAGLESGCLREMDPKIGAMISRTLSLLEERLRVLGHTDVSAIASFKARLPHRVPLRPSRVEAAGTVKSNVNLRERRANWSERGEHLTVCSSA